MLVRRAWGGRAAGSIPSIVGGRPWRGVFLVAAGATVAAVPTVEEMHQWTKRQQQEGQGAHQVGAVLGEKEETGDREEAEKDPGQRGAALRAWAGRRNGNGRSFDHDVRPFGCGVGPGIDLLKESAGHMQ